MNNLIFHYQNILYPGKQGIFLHEAFSTRSGELYSVNPLSVEVAGDTEEEVEEVLRAMEADSTKYKPVKLSNVDKQMSRWIDEVDITFNTVTPEYEDADDLEEDYYNESGEVIDICEYMDKNRR